MSTEPARASVAGTPGGCDSLASPKFLDEPSKTIFVSAALGKAQKGISGSVLLIIFRSLISLCFITCLIHISLNLKNDQKNRPHDPFSHIQHGHEEKGNPWPVQT